MPQYLASVGTVANGTTWTGPYIPPTQGLPIGEVPYTLLNAESLSALVPVASIAVNLGKKDDSHPGAVSLEIFFSAAPGVFEVDFQTADTDADGLYQQEGLAVNSVNATTQATRAEFLNVTTNFARVLVKTLTNNVKITVRLTYR